MKKKKKVPTEFDIRRKSDGQKVFGPVNAYTADQVVGFYATIIIKRPWDKGKYYAIKCQSPVVKPAKSQVVKPRKSLVKSGACPACGYIDPQKDQVTQCPNCEYTGSS